MAASTQPTKVTYPSVPPATDLPSCIAAVNALAAVVRILTNTGPGTNNG